MAISRFIPAFIALLSAQQGFSQQQHRIITAGSTLSEIVCALGHCDEVVATDQTSVYPSRLTTLPSIGYRTGINAEGVLAQRPTLVLADREYVRQEVIEQLEGAHVKVYGFDKSTSWEETRALITSIGKVLNESSRAEKLIGTLDHQLDALASTAKKATNAPTVLFIYARGAGTQLIAGKGTFTEQLITLAGGSPATAVEGFKPLNAEALIVANPDYILLANDGLESLGGIPGVLDIPGVLQTKAGKEKRIISLDMVMMSNFGPRLPQAVRSLMQMIHPELGI